MSALAMLYATYIVKGDKQYKDVPELLKPQVKQILEDQGLGYLTQ
ncbi:CD1375 family protein [Neobacillus massiliamazoniensis]|uniref:CD1375-like domain-containing protein n=1 Tax=Neobacillus massiliamazoniensis TaxID=1499688 RepID=A0A0U1NQH3_9BACI|nr:hypothetical protein [Neobacillus massiliamazoniensis]CRK80296.1 hypothetical protein BN000_00177 [Neobacillus massiliamazoniensis]